MWKDLRLERFCFLLSFISTLLCNNSTVQFGWSLTPKFFAVFSLHASVISLLNWWLCSEFFSLFQCLKVRFYWEWSILCLFSEWGAYYINISGSVIWVSVFWSVFFFSFQCGISESNKDSKFECRSVIISYIIGPYGQQWSKPIVS